MTSETDTSKRTRDLAVFWFLVDAPMFTDDDLVSRFHDSVLRPERYVVGESEVEGKARETDNRFGFEGEGKGKVPLVVELSGQATFDRSAKRVEQASVTRQLNVPRTTERLLEELVAFYLANFPQRVLRVDPVTRVITLPAIGSEGCGYEKLDQICNEAGPRPLVLLDCPAGTKLMPMAGEFVSGKVEIVYDDLINALSSADKPLTRFDRRSPPPKDKNAIWKELTDAFDARVAMHVLEDAGKKHDGARFHWIDFRMPWGDSEKYSPLHLHLVPSGRYSMGTFAHAFINRGFSQGVRILGSLKTGGDINVLAIYER